MATTKKKTAKKTTPEWEAQKGTFKTDKERASRAGRKGGKSLSPKKINATVKNFSKSPVWMNNERKLSPEQQHFMMLLGNNQFVQAIKDMLLVIACRAESADDYHRLLTQLMKIPFLQQTLNELSKETQRDVIPIVIEVLREEGAEHIIKKLHERLQREGWHETPPDTTVTTVSSMRDAKE